MVKNLAPTYTLSTQTFGDDIYTKRSRFFLESWFFSQILSHISISFLSNCNHAEFLLKAFSDPRIFLFVTILEVALVHVFFSVICCRLVVLYSSIAKKDTFSKGLQHALAFLTSHGMAFSLSVYVSIVAKVLYLSWVRIYIHFFLPSVKINEKVNTKDVSHWVF